MLDPGASVRRAAIMVVTLATGFAASPRIAFAQPSAAPWKLVPELRVGSEQSPDYALTMPRTIAVDDDGAIFVCLILENQIRVFDADGRFVRNIGRRGSGPGEFSRLARVGIRGDTLWAIDGLRIHFFAKDGSLFATTVVRFMPPPGEHLRASNLTDLLVGDLVVGRVGASQLPDVPDVVPVPATTRQGATAATLAEVDVSWFRWYTFDGRRRVATVPFFVQGPYAFPPDGTYGIFVEQRSRDPEQPTPLRVRRVDVQGRTVFTRDVEYEPLPVPSIVRDSILAVDRSELPGGRREVEVMRRAAPIPRFYPPVRAITIGRDDTMWLELQGHRPRQWLVLGADGSTAGAVGPPGLIAIGAASATHVWGVEVDALDVPTIVRYRIERR
jgi:hypothetical protein